METWVLIEESDRSEVSFDGSDVTTTVTVSTSELRHLLDRAGYSKEEDGD